MSKSNLISIDKNEQFEITDFVKLYPNPTQGIVTFDIDYTKHNNVEVTIYNIQGTLVQSELITNDVSFIDLGNLENGIYIIKTKLDDNNITSSKVVIRK